MQKKCLFFSTLLTSFIRDADLQRAIELSERDAIQRQINARDGMAPQLTGNSESSYQPYYFSSTSQTSAPPKTDFIDFFSSVEAPAQQSSSNYGGAFGNQDPFVAQQQQLYQQQQQLQNQMFMQQQALTSLPSQGNPFMAGGNNPFMTGPSQAPVYAQQQMPPQMPPQFQQQAQMDFGPTANMSRTGFVDFYLLTRKETRLIHLPVWLRLALHRKFIQVCEILFKQSSDARISEFQSFWRTSASAPTSRSCRSRQFRC